MRKDKVAKKEKVKDIRLVLLAARSCCLDCQYCFVKKTNELMSKGILKKAIDFLFTSEARNLQLQFFGGEPLMLPSDIFKWSIEYTVAKSSKLKKSLKIIITTNAVYLTQNKINFLKKYKNHIIIEVSLDGRKESHNTNRPQKDKSRIVDSYTMITKNFPALISSGLYARISMVVSPHTSAELLENFTHLLELGFNKIWIMFSCGILWRNADILEFRRQLRKIEQKYYRQIKEGKILFMNLRDWFVPYRMNSELIVDINGKVYPACMNYLVEDEAVKEKYCLGNLNNPNIRNIDYYEEKRISNQKAIDVFFRVNKIVPNYESNIKTGIMISKFVKRLNKRLKEDRVDVLKFFHEYRE